jgi:hypothetical protein
MPSERLRSNKEVCQTQISCCPPRPSTNHLSPVKGEFGGGSGGQLIYNTLGFHHLGRAVSERNNKIKRDGCLLGLNWKDGEQKVGTVEEFKHSAEAWTGLCHHGLAWPDIFWGMLDACDSIYMNKISHRF